MVGGDYQLRVQLLDPSETLIAEEFAPITVSPRSAIARPHFFYRRGFNPEVPGLLALARGEQLWALGRNEEARAAFQESVAAGNPELPMARWLLAGVFLTEGDGDAALELLAPLEEALPGQYEVLAGLGFARFLRGELEQATGYLEKAMTIRQPDTNLLNALGDIVSWGTSKRLGTSISARWRSTLTRKPSSGIWKRSAKAGKWVAFTTPARVKTLTSEITSGAIQLPDIAVVYTRGTNGARLRSKSFPPHPGPRVLTSPALLNPRSTSTRRHLSGVEPRFVVASRFAWMFVPAGSIVTRHTLTSYCLHRLNELHTPSRWHKMR